MNSESKSPVRSGISAQELSTHDVALGLLDLGGQEGTVPRVVLHPEVEALTLGLEGCCVLGWWCGRDLAARGRHCVGPPDWADGTAAASLGGILTLIGLWGSPNWIDAT
ncbi:hypothetical protein V2G26_019503 [Clonostachys chloroleuca]